MPVGFYADVTRELRSLGYEYVRNAKGSHEKWAKPVNGIKLIVPRNLNSRHTANAILKQAGSETRL